MKLLLSRLTTKSKPIVIKLYIVKYLEDLMLGILIEYRIVDMQGQNAIWRQGRKNLIFCDSP